MERSIFGSTLSLGALLNDNLLTDGEADQFLQEMDVTNSRSFEDPDVVEVHSGANSFASCLTGTGVDEGFVNTSCTLAAFPSQFPTLNSTSQKQAPADTQPQVPGTSPALSQGSQEGLLLLGQLLSLLGSSASGAAQGQGTSLPVQSAQPQKKAAFKPAAPSAQELMTVPQEVAPPANSNSMKLPNLNAQQQQALQSLMDLGQLGSTKEGKKVRRMLSNRESARRSRHRKQAHMHEIEEKASRMEADNEVMRLALARAAEQETQSTEERAQLYKEIAYLRSKVDLLEKTLAGHSSNIVGDHNAKRGVSLSSTGGDASSDSCCDSLTTKRVRSCH